MSKFDILPQFECRNRILNVKFDVWPSFECQNRTLNVNCDIQSQLECQNNILNVKIRYSASICMSKYDFECQITIFRPSSNVKIGLNVKMRYSARF